MNAPEDVRELVEVADVVEEELARPVVEHPVVLQPILAADDARLVDELARVEQIPLDRLGVLGHLLGVEAPRGLGHLRREALGARDRHRGRHRIHLDRAHVELELGLHRLEVEAHDAAD